MGVHLYMTFERDVASGDCWQQTPDLSVDSKNRVFKALVRLSRWHSAMDHLLGSLWMQLDNVVATRVREVLS